MTLAALLAWIGVTICAWVVFAFFAPRMAEAARRRVVAWIVAARRGRRGKVWR